jgi:hypothetical protein
MATTEPHATGVHAGELRRLLDGRYADLRRRILEVAIEQDRGYLQEHGRLTGPRCKAVTRQVNRLCDEVRGDAEALVDAFGIPDGVLRAPIGLRDPA